LLVILVTFVLGTFVNNVRADQRFALVITNQAYPAEIGPLSKSHSDGETLSQALRSVGFEVRLLKDADKSAMLGAILEYATLLEKAGSDAIGFFYYSGHGAATEKFGDNYLVPIAAQISSQLQLTTLSVKLGEIIDTLSQTNAQVNFVVIDACRNVAFSPVRGQRGLKPEPERRGMLIEFSTGPGDVAVDDNVFSRALAEEMSKPGRETLQVFRAVRLKVLEATQDRQFPWTRDGMVRDFWFAGPPVVDANAAQLNAARMLAEWEGIKDSADASLLEKFEHRYVGEILSAEARRRRLALAPQVQSLQRTYIRETPIMVWNVASPHGVPGVERSAGFPSRADPIGFVPPRLQRRATALGYTIDVKVVSAKEFAPQLFDAIGTANQPDIISIDNYGHLEGITTPQGTFTGIWTNPEVRKNLVSVEEVLREFANGWQFLLRGSPNHDKARALVEDLVECDELPSESTSAEFSQVRALSEPAATAHVECRPLEKDKADPQRFPTTCSQANAPLRVKVIKTCKISGNDRLAFASAVVGIENNERIGRRSVVTVLRKAAKWQALTVASDPVSAKEFASDAISFGRRLESAANASTPVEPAAILTPDGSFPSPKAGERFGDFVWKGSPSLDVRAEIAELSYGSDVRLFLYLGAAPNEQRLLSTGKLWTTESPWVWRVWSIKGDGTVAFSDTRQFRY
jgi:hypothetical protein